MNTLLGLLPVLFVVHGSQYYDHSLSAKPGIDAAVRTFKERNWPVIYLNLCHDDQYGPYMEDRRPTAQICSEAGEHGLDLSTRDIYIAGGWLELCAYNTTGLSVRSALIHQARENPQARPAVTVHYILDAIFTKAGGTALAMWDKSPGRLSDAGGFFADLAPQLETGASPLQDGSNIEVRTYYEDRPLDAVSPGRDSSGPLVTLRFTTSDAILKQDGAPGRN